MQAINNNSYSSQGIQPNSVYGQPNQVNMPKPPIASPMAQNSSQVPAVDSYSAQGQQTQTNPIQTAPTQIAPMYPQGVNIPAGGAVNINIFNPTTTNGAPIYPQNTYYTNPATTYPAYVPQGAMMLPQMPAPQNAYPAIQTQQTNVQIPAPQQMQSQDAQNLNQTPQTSQAGQTPQTEEKPANITPLNDEYIKTLENYLNDNDPKVRLMGATQLLDRFKEHESRKSDPALTALLNKALKDPTASVRQMALTTINVGYAIGNEETIAILNNIQTNTSSDIYAEDALAAKEALLKLSQQGQVITPSGAIATKQV